MLGLKLIIGVAGSKSSIMQCLLNDEYWRGLVLFAHKIIFFAVSIGISTLQILVEKSWLTIKLINA